MTRRHAYQLCGNPAIRMTGGPEPPSTMWKRIAAAAIIRCRNALPPSSMVPMELTGTLGDLRGCGGFKERFAPGLGSDYGAARRAAILPESRGQIVPS